jgi:putative hydrolase of the HAD superfamily
MIKAVFFDLYQTIVKFDPPREEIQSKVLAEYGIQVAPEKLAYPLVVADEYMYAEHARLPFGKRSDEERKAIWGQYQAIVLKEAGIEPKRELIGGILGRMQQIKFERALFDDVMPALNGLRDRGLILGLISNVDSDIKAILDKLGLSPLLSVVVTSLDSGYVKPQPEIFKEAARRADISPAESAYVGDQYQIDVIGAQNAGMRGILLDRGDYFKDTIKEPRIQTLSRLGETLT